jgi:Zn-dependent protease with chaperone function
MMLVVELAALLCTLIGALAWALVVILGRWWPGRRGPAAHRERTARTWLYAPLWVPVVVLVAAGVSRAIAAGLDHCATHGVHHHHVCLLHLPAGRGHAIAWAVSLAAFAPAGAILAWWFYRAIHEVRTVRMLVRSTTPSAFGRKVRVLEQREPIALTVGWVQPVILVSRGLLDTVSERTLAVVLAHEHAHRRRRHPLHAFVDRWFASLLPGRVSAHLMRVLTLAREQRCDLDAARHVGSRVDVARALTEVARLNRHAPNVGASIGGGDLAARIDALLAPDPPAAPLSANPIVAVGLAIAVGSGPLFVGFEHAVARMLH